MTGWQSLPFREWIKGGKSIRQWRIFFPDFLKASHSEDRAWNHPRPGPNSLWPSVLNHLKCSQVNIQWMENFCDPSVKVNLEAGKRVTQGSNLTMTERWPKCYVWKCVSQRQLIILFIRFLISPNFPLGIDTVAMTIQGFADIHASITKCRFDIKPALFLPLPFTPCTATGQHSGNTIVTAILPVVQAFTPSGFARYFFYAGVGHFFNPIASVIY
jgi:hypothetical protein